MSNKILNIGFIGGGINSAIGNTHRIASQMDGRFLVAAGCFSRNSQINLETAQKWNIDPKRAYSDWKTMLEKEKDKLDAVVILTPIAMHYEMIKSALELGYPVICEKPITNNSEDAQKLNHLVNEKNGFLVFTYNYTGYPMVRELKNMIEKNFLGKILQVQIEMPQETFIRLEEDGKPCKPQSWRLEDFENVATVSLDLGAHLHNLIYFLTNSKPQEVFAQASSKGHFEVIDNVSSISKWQNDIECNIWYSKTALGYSNGLKVRIFGDKGAAEWYQMDPEFLNFTDHNGKKTIFDRKTNPTKLATQERYNRFKAGHPQGFMEAFANYYHDIADCLNDYKKNKKYESPYVFKSDAAWEGLKFLEAITTSANKKSLVKL